MLFKLISFSALTTVYQPTNAGTQPLSTLHFSQLPRTAELSPVSQVFLSLALVGVLQGTHVPSQDYVRFDLKLGFNISCNISAQSTDA